jgi:glycosyltransferase involved in cell wall biosynthesis
MKISNSSKPTITVLMSCYNAEKWLISSVPSVLNQTFTNFEFIIIDDGSADNTLNIIHDFAKTDSRIVVLSKPNTGLSDSLNIGIQMARGDWIARIDADDIFEPMKLEKQILATEKNPNLVFIGTGLTIIDDSGRKLNTYNYPSKHALLSRNLKTARKFPPHASAMYKTSAVRKLGGYRGRVSKAEDADLWLRLSEVGELTSVTGPYVQIRKHSGQISHFENGTRQMLDARIATVASWLRHYKHQDPISLDEHSFNNYHTWIKNQLTHDKLFEYLAFKNNLHDKFNDSKKSVHSIYFLSALILTNPLNSARYICEKMFGETLPRKLAKKWILKEVNNQS